MVSKPANFVKRLTSRGLLAAAAASVVTALACVHNDGSVFIGGVLAPPVPVQGSACTYTASSTGPFLFQGTLDVGLASQYSPVVLVGNQLIARGDQTQVRVETSRFIIQGVIVRLTDAAGAEITSYTVQVAGQVEPAAGATPSYGSTVVTLVPPETVKLLRGALTVRGPSKRVVAYFKVYGQTLNGASIESTEYQFPVDTCLGCLVSFSTAVCGGGGSSTTIQADACQRGMDQPVDACLCKSNAVCN